MTNEARVLRELRISKKLSMRTVGQLVGLSDSYIAHIETGRVDLPKDPVIERFLHVYGPMKLKSFYERVRNYREKVTPRMELTEIIQRADEKQLQTLLAVAKGLMS